MGVHARPSRVPGNHAEQVCRLIAMCHLPVQLEESDISPLFPPVYFSCKSPDTALHYAAHIVKGMYLFQRTAHYSIIYRFPRDARAGFPRAQHLQSGTRFQCSSAAIYAWPELKQCSAPSSPHSKIYPSVRGKDLHWMGDWRASHWHRDDWDEPSFAPLTALSGCLRSYHALFHAL